jgi:hypothetical protein
MHQACDGGAVYLAQDWWDDLGGVDTTGLSSSAAGALLADLGRAAAARRAFFAECCASAGCPRH